MNSGKCKLYVYDSSRKTNKYEVTHQFCCHVFGSNTLLSPPPPQAITNSLAHYLYSLLLFLSYACRVQLKQGVTKRCRLSCWPIAPSYMSPNAGGGSCGVSANEYSCAVHRSLNTLWISNFIFNLWAEGKEGERSQLRRQQKLFSVY